MSKPKLRALPATLFLVGLGLCLHYGPAWWRLPSYTQADIAASVDLNLVMDLQRQGRDAGMEEARLKTLRDRIDRELRADIAHERQEVLRGIAAGAAMLLFALGQMYWLGRLASRQATIPTR